MNFRHTPHGRTGPNTSRGLWLTSLVAVLLVSSLAVGCSGNDKGDSSRKAKDDKKSQTDTEEGAEQITKKMSSTEVLGVDSQFKSFIDLVKKAKIVDTIDDAKELTLFVPNTEAFEALGEGTIDELSKDPDALAGYLERYLVKGTFTINDLVNKNDDELETLAGTKAKIGADDQGNVTFDGAPLIKFDIATSNATIHVLNQALAP